MVGSISWRLSHIFFGSVVDATLLTNRAISKSSNECRKPKSAAGRVAVLNTGRVTRSSVRSGLAPRLVAARSRLVSKFLRAETMTSVARGNAPIVWPSATAKTDPVKRNVENKKNTEIAITMLGRIAGEITSAYMKGRSRERERTSPNAVGIARASVSTMVRRAASRLEPVALIQPGRTKYASYHCHEKPCGGKARYALALSDSGMMIDR